ncbi:MAG: amidohydrolase family protein [Geminicoccaceae bacterium]
MASTLIKNARIFDGEGLSCPENGSIVIEGEHIREVGENLTIASEARTVDAGGRFLMPGLIDAHFHANTPSYDFYATDRMPKALLAAHAGKMLTDTLHRGFTTVRDAGGGDYGLWAALQEGLIDGPRFFFPGRAITQTGGHADMRRRDFIEPCGCAYSGTLGQIVDGPDQMRHAVRDEFRKGAHQIKIFASGGVSTDLAPLWMAHFTDEEISVAVEEAARRRSYVMAHCHTDDGARRCLEQGVRTIEHGSLITPETAAMIERAGAFVVPTLSAGKMIASHAETIGLPASAADKVKEVSELAKAAVENCARAGVKLGLGCDLHGHDFLKSQGRELMLRGEIQSPTEVLCSATSVNARIVRQEGKIGAIRSGALADIIIVDGDPLTDLSLFAHPERTVAMVMKGGRLVRSSL